MAIGVIFSGQGAQHVGMGKGLYEANSVIRDFWDRANDVLGFDLKTLSFEGPDEALTETRVCQPALYVHGYSIFSALGLTGVHAALGLSLGELTALAAAEVFDFETGLRVVAKRGELMQQACESTQGTMASLIGGSLDLVKSLCSDFDIDMANLNSPGQIVISGSTEKVNVAVEKAKTMDFKRVIPLNVAGAYHSRLMQPAADSFKSFLEGIEFSKPKITVFTNTTGESVVEPEAIKDALVKQVTSSVLWVNCMENAHALGITTFYECGPGKVLKGLAKRINADIEVHSVSEVDEFELLTIN